jgi:predicted ATPase
MTISVSAVNFGPILDGTVEILPFTVFIGPNNTGKSFLSTLIYAAETRRASFRVTTGRDSSMQRQLLGNLRNAVKRHLRRPGTDLHRIFSSMPRTSQAALVDLAREELKAYARNLQAELERCLGGTIDDLASATRPADSAMELSVRESLVGWSVRLIYSDPDMDVQVSLPPHRKIFEWADEEAYSQLQRYFPERENGPGLEISGLPLRRMDDLLEQLISLFLPQILESLRGYLFRGFPRSRHYLPAARSGIMQSHKSLAAFLVRSAPLVGLQEMEVPQLSGTVTDFISQLLNLDVSRRRQPRATLTANSRLAAVADELESKVLHGKIEIRPAPSGYPEILYRVGRMEAPLVRLSSMISELAPVVLYIRYVLAPGDHLIIEEPEAHLHPESQREFARALADLLALHVNITLTTHSDYLLTEINNLIRERTVAHVTGTESPPGSIPAARVAAYLFTRREGQRGTAVESIAVSESEGISDEEFSRVTEEIYHEAANLQYKIIQAVGSGNEE